MAAGSDDEVVFRMPERGRRERRLVAGWIVFGLLGLFLVVQAVTYRGIIALAAEWQFNTFGRYYPALTWLCLVAILLLPLAIWSLVRRRRERKRAAIEGAAPNAQPAGVYLLRILISLVAAALIAALVALILALAAPTGGKEARQVVAGPLGPQLPATGPTVLFGQTLYERTAAFDEDYWLTKRSFRYAPVIGLQGDEGRQLRFFVELPPEARETNPPRVGSRIGILTRGGLPGEVLRLYRYAGYRVDEPYFVLAASSASVRWPYLMIAVQCLLAALVAALTAVLVWLPVRERVSWRRTRPPTVAAEVA